MGVRSRHLVSRSVLGTSLRFFHQTINSQPIKMYAARLVLPATRAVAMRSPNMAQASAAPMVMFRSLQTTPVTRDIDMAAKYIGAGAGIGSVFGSLIIGYARNPSLKQQLFSYAILGFALSEAMGLFCLMMAFLLLFAF